MRAVIPFVLVALGACYDPAAVDCTLQCSQPTECASGQVCGSDGFCAAPSVAGHCGGPDGGMQAQLVTLKIALSGQGKVTIDGVGYCDSSMSDSCSFSVPGGTALSLKAVPHEDRDFESWSGGCAGNDPTCGLTAAAAITQVGAKFK